MNLGKLLGIVVFLLVIILQLFLITGHNLNEVPSLIKNSIIQLSSFNLPQPIIKFYIYNNSITLSFNNTDNFPYTLLNVSGKYTYLKYPVTFVPHAVTNATIIVTNWQSFIQEAKNNDYNITLTFEIYNTTFSQSETL